MTPFSADYRLTMPDGESEECGPCSITIDSPGFTLTPLGTAAIPVRFAEVATWHAADYTLIFTLTDGSILQLSRLAKRFDEFADSFRQARREHFQRSLLLEERSASLYESGSYERGTAVGSCSVHLQITSLACFPDQEFPFLLPYGAITGLDRDTGGYCLTITTDDGHMKLNRFGKMTDDLCRQLELLRSELAKRQAEALAALSPETSALALRRAGQMLRDGIPAERGQLESAAAGLWDDIWSSGFNEERRPYATHLQELASATYVVIKETGSWGAPENTTPALLDRRLLFLFRIGEKLVVETPSAEDTATYLFHLVDDEAGFVRRLCRALAAIQFRREPLYLSLASMATAPHDRYAEACRLLPELVAARRSFAGRAIHASLDSWKNELNKFLG